jgi:uncharacterized protein
LIILKKVITLSIGYSAQIESFAAKQKTLNKRLDESMPMKFNFHPFLEVKLNELNKLCTAYKVKRLYAFGSIVTDHFNEKESDVDLQVELLPIADPVEKGLTLLEFWNALELLFGKKVDLLTEQPIHNPYLKEALESSKILVYECASQEVLI